MKIDHFDILQELGRGRLPDVDRELPFQGEDISSLAWRIMHEPPSLGEFGPALAPPVAGALNRALSKDPAGRYATCSQFATDLTAALTPLAKGNQAATKWQDPREVERAINLGFDGAIEGGFPHGWFNSAGHVSVLLLPARTPDFWASAGGKGILR